jgi:hypothetical protein
MTTPKNMKQRRKLDKLVVAFPDYGIPYHLQHIVGHPIDKELLILHVLATLIRMWLAHEPRAGSGERGAGSRDKESREQGLS